MSAAGLTDAATPSSRADPKDLQAFAQGIRRIVLEQSMRAGVGHIGSALSIADIVAALYGGRPRVADPHDPDRDRFVLSKGHASLAVYAALYLRDWLTRTTSCRRTARTARGSGPPGARRPWNRLRDRVARARPLAGRGRGARRAARGLDAAGVLPAQRCRVQRGVSLGGRHVRGAPPAVQPRRDRRPERAAGARLHEGRARPVADGRALARIRLGRARGGRSRSGRARDTIRELDVEAGPPHVLVAHTVFGKGVSFMERSIEWHYLPMTEGQFERAMQEVAA